ncbi:MAG: leucine--tRNA ligase [Actinomycetota bacterium]
MRRYDPHEIEPKWQARWEEEGLYTAAEEEDGRPKFYALDMFPYPSGDLHMGHGEAFAIGDVIARYKWMQGFNVLHPIGWDAFGLPAENAAIQRGIPPKEWTYENIEQQRASFKRYGVSFDWTRQFNTCDPDYYKWTQWLFVKFFERGLAYRKNAPANWCPKDQTVLANEQVINGLCERCDTPVVRRDLTQWFLRITDYAEKLLDDMEELRGGWSDRVLTMQRNWIGRSEGAEVLFRVAETGDPVPVFTTRPDTLWGVTFFVFAPEHPLVPRLAEAGGRAQELRALVEKYRAMPLTSREQAENREGVSLGVRVVNPVNGEEVPCFVAPYVLMEYGTGAVMAVPAHDQRDFEFARENGLPVRIVIKPPEGPTEGAQLTEAWTGEGVMVNSGPFDGRPSPASIDEVTAWVEEKGLGKRAVSYRLRDWLISRQRYWGAPIPMIHCPEHGEVAVPEDELPVLLPDDVDFKPGGDSPLARHEGFVNVECPKCGKPARRDTDTMDTFVDSSWYFFRYCSPRFDEGPFDPAAVSRWMPVDQYTGGITHAILHLLYARFFTKAIRDLGLISFGEPFTRLLNQGMVIMQGSAMSKSRGNLVVFADELNKHGADVLRVSMLFAGPVEDDVDWQNVSPEGVKSWLGRVWRAVHEASEGSGPDAEELRRIAHRTVKVVTTDYERHAYNTAVAKLMTLTNEIRRSLDAGGSAGESASLLVQMIAPMAPFIAEELWREVLGNTSSVHSGAWPEFEPALVEEDRVTLVVQVNGKVRDRIEVAAAAAEDEVRELALASENARRAVGEKEVSRVIVRPPRLANIVTS